MLRIVDHLVDQRDRSGACLDRRHDRARSALADAVAGDLAAEYARYDLVVAVIRGLESKRGAFVRCAHVAMYRRVSPASQQKTKATQKKIFVASAARQWQTCGMGKPISKTGRRLLRMREMRGLTQHQLAARSKVSRATIAALECGARHTSTLSTLLKLSAALDERGSMALVRR